MRNRRAQMNAATSQFDEAEILAEATDKAGLTRFGDDAFREPLRVLLASLAQSPLHPLGAQILRRSTVWSLISRLRARYSVSYTHLTLPTKA